MTKVKKVVYSLIFLAIAYVIGLINGAFLFNDIDILSTYEGVDIRLDSELRVDGGGAEEDQVLVLPKGTYLHYFRSTAWDDTLTIKIITYNDIKEISTVVSDKKSKSIYFEILEESHENY